MLTIFHLINIHPALASAITNVLPGGGPTSIQQLVNSIFNWLTYTIGVVGVAMMVYSGFMYIISVGRPDKTKQALQSIIYTSVGFGIAILARAIVDFVIPKVSGSPNIGTLVATGLNTFMWAIGIAAVIVMIIAAIFYVISAGDTGRTKTAKDAIVYASVGLAIALVGGSGITLLANSVLAP